MRWKLILLLSSIGLLSGAASVLGYLRGIDVWLWLTMCAAFAYIIAKYSRSRFFAHGFATGALASLTSSVVRLAFFEIWLANNPKMAAAAEIISRTWPVDVWWISMFITPNVAAVNGLLVGLLAVGFSKVDGKCR